MEIVFTPKIDDVRAALDTIERRAREGIHVGFMAPTGTAGGGLSGGVGLPNSSAILGQSPPATANPLRGLTDAQSDRRFRSQIAYDVSTMAGDPLRQAQTLNEAAGSFEPGTVDNLRYRTAANRASSRYFAGEERTFNQGIRDLARQEARSIGRRADAPEGFWGGEGGGGGGGGAAPAPGSGGGSWGRVGGFGLVQRAMGFGGFGGEGGGRIFGINPYGGFGRYMSAGFLLRAASGSMEAGREYGVGMMLAGGNQSEELNATLQYRQGIAHAWGFIGQGVAFAQDPTGSKEAGIRATIKSVDAAEQRRAFTSSQSDFSRTIRNEYAIAKEHDPVQKQLEQVRADEDAGRAAVSRRVEADAQIRDKEIEAKKAKLEASVDTRVFKDATLGFLQRQVYGPGGKVMTPDEARALYRADDQKTIAGMREESARGGAKIRKEGDEAVAGTAAERRAEIIRNEDFRGQIMAARYGGEEAVNAAILSGDAGAARVASIRAANRETELAAQQARDPRLGEIQRQGAGRVVMAEKVNERERQLDVADIAGSSRIARNYDPGNPLANQLAAIDEKAARATRRDKRPGMAEAFEEDRLAEREQAERAENYEKRYRRAELTADRRGLEREAAGNFLAAQSSRTADAARIDASKLSERGDKVGADMVLGNAVLQQQAMRTRILQTFEGREIDINRTALSGPRGGEDPIEALHTIADEIRGLRLDQRNGVSVPAVVD